MLCLHVALVLRAYPPAAFVANEPPLRGDVDRYYANAWGAAQAGGLYGYDVSNMAGYPVGLWNSMGKKGFEIAHLLLPWIGLPRLFYGVIVGLALVSPLVLYVATRRCMASALGRGILLTLSLLVWHLDAQISYFWGFGNVFFPGTVCAAIALVATTVRMVEQPAAWGWGVLQGLLAAAIFYGHTVLIVAVLAPVAWVLVTRREVLRQPRFWIGQSVALALALTLCLPWLIPLWQSRAILEASPDRWFPGGPKELIMDVLSDRVYQRPFDRNFMTQFAVVAGAFGLWLTRRRPGLLAVRALGVGGAAALVITYVFPLLGWGRFLQPYRFIIPGVLFLLPAAALAVEAVVMAFGRLPAEGRAAVLMLFLLVLPRLTAQGLDLMRPPGQAIGVPSIYRAIANALPRESVSGRVLCEDPGLGHVVPCLTGLPVIGGLSSQAFLKHRFAGAVRGGAILGCRAEACPADAFAAVLNTYAVSHAVFSSRTWIHYAQAAPDLFTPVAVVGGHGLYRVHTPTPGYVLEGVAEVTVAPRAIAVRDVRQQPLLLKFHADPMLVADQGVMLQPQAVATDPVPFIRCVVPEGVTNFTIRW